VRHNRKLDEAVHELYRLLEQDTDEPDDPPGYPTDYVLIVGSMFIDNDDGGRLGCVSVFPKEGSQPAYITTGLVESARQSINR
jgi:hypothetical protein